MLPGHIWASRRWRIFESPLACFGGKSRRTGFATAEDVASGWCPISFTLDPVESVPPGMVRVSAGDSFKLSMPGFENVAPVHLQDYWIDRYEVTNKQFKKFVDSGGYQKREYWIIRF